MPLIVIIIALLLASCTPQSEEKQEKFYETEANLTGTIKLNETKEELEERLLSIQEIKDSPKCEIPSYCNNLVAINCMAEFDGPLFYVEKTSGIIIERCGGFCIDPLKTGYCKKCPPENWTCNDKFEL